MHIIMCLTRRACCADGTPAILYTGVAKKPDAGEREAMPMTVNKLCYERQLLARPADPSKHQ